MQNHVRNTGLLGLPILGNKMRSFAHTTSLKRQFWLALMPAILLAAIASLAVRTGPARMNQQDDSPNSLSDTVAPAASELLEISGTEEGTHTKVELKSDTQSVNGQLAPPEINLKVNGQTVPVPENGTQENVITGDDGQGNVNVQIQSDSSGTDDGDSRVRIRIESENDVNIRAP